MRTRSTQHPTAGVAGAGIMGRMMAWHLLQAGWEVTLFDEDTSSSRQSCSTAAAGMLAPFAEIEHTPPFVLQMGCDALEYWKKLLSTWSSPVFYRSAGTLCISHPTDHAEYTRFRDLCTQKLPKAYQPSSCNPASIAELEPELGFRFSQALYFPHEAHLDNQQVLSALQQALQQHPQCHWKQACTVTATAPHTLSTHEDTLHFDHVFDCRGLGAQLTQPPLRGIRGELLWLEAKEVQLHRLIRLMHPRYPLYIVPRPQCQYIIGASEIDCEDRSPISAQTTLELLSAAYSVHPGFAEARLIKTVTQCRPAFPDNIPRLLHTLGLTHLNGLYRQGYLLAPILAQEALILLEKGAKNLHYPELCHTLSPSTIRNCN